jgi:hypothetical protein
MKVTKNRIVLETEEEFWAFEKVYQDYIFQKIDYEQLIASCFHSEQIKKDG